MSAVQRTAGQSVVRHYFAEAGRWLSSEGDATVSADIVGFLDPIDQFCLAPPPRYARSTLYIVAGLVLTLLFISAVVKVDLFVVGTGRIATAKPPILVQPVDRAIVREIFVRAGDQVHKGQVLATLDPTFARADLGVLAAQREGLQAENDRLEAEAAGRPYVAGAHPTTDQTLQATLFQQRQANYASRLRVYDEDVARLESNIKATLQDVSVLEKQLDVAKELENMRFQTMQSQTGSRLNYLDAQGLRMRTERDHQDSFNHLAELKFQVQSRQAERQSFIDEWRRAILEQQAQTRTHLSTTVESMSKASFVNDMVQLTASVDGTILDSAPRAVGSILHEAEPLFSIVPTDSPLVAEIQVGSSDVGTLKAGDEALIKIDAFPYNRHGTVEGKLLYISEEASSANSLTGQQASDTGGAMHRARVQLTDTTLRNMPEGAHLMPGMTLQAEIKVGSRSILGYFLSPVTRGITEALHET